MKGLFIKIEASKQKDFENIIGAVPFFIDEKDLDKELEVEKFKEHGAFAFKLLFKQIKDKIIEK